MKLLTIRGSGERRKLPSGVWGGAPAAFDSRGRPIWHQMGITPDYKWSYFGTDVFQKFRLIHLFCNFAKFIMNSI